MIQLYDWYIEKINDKTCMAHGYVEGHPDLPDGTFIHTSPVAQAGKDGEQGILLVTRSDSHYRLAGEDICLEEIKNTKKNLKVLGVRDFCKDAVQLLHQKKERKRREMETCLSDHELFLMMLGEHCMEVYFKDGGGIHELQVSVHVGMFQDSVLCRKNGVADFRYFPKGFYYPEIDTYHVSSNIERIHLCNAGNMGILFNKVLCKAKTVTLVEKAHFGGEGLLTPDVYDGKCLLFGGIKED